MVEVPQDPGQDRLSGSGIGILVGAVPQRLLEDVDHARHGVEREATQPNGPDPLRGDHQGVAAVAADIEHHQVAAARLGDEILAPRRQPEGREAGQGPDLLLQLGEGPCGPVGSCS
ncbi:hypothetical protein [Streptomyces rubiginosohelvolus]|uniref:hypothetical protein n=1 Tax=Streptomyces rubiginosohelvolus TaxID=67362 RepID=UPI0035E01B2C